MDSEGSLNVACEISGDSSPHHSYKVLQHPQKYGSYVQAPHSREYRSKEWNHSPWSSPRKLWTARWSKLRRVISFLNIRLHPRRLAARPWNNDAWSTIFLEENKDFRGKLLNFQGIILPNLPNALQQNCFFCTESKRSLEYTWIIKSFVLLYTSIMTVMTVKEIYSQMQLVEACQGAVKRIMCGPLTLSNHFRNSCFSCCQIRNSKRGRFKHLW